MIMMESKELKPHYHGNKRYTELPTRDRLIELLDYNPHKGSLLWKPRLPEDFAFNQFPEACAKQFNKLYAGTSALNTLIDQENPWYGYQVTIEQKKYSTCRIVWKMYYGYDEVEIFALNGDRRMIYIENLASEGFTGPHLNARPNIRNSSGVKGVYWNKEKKKWQAQIQIGGVVRSLGRFSSLEDATQARRNAEISYQARGNAI